MGFLDNITNRFQGFNEDDDDYEDDDLEGYEDDEEEESPRGIFTRRNNKRQNDDDDDYEERRPSGPSGNGNRASLRPTNNNRSGGAQITPMRQPSGAMSGSKMQVRVIKPSSFDQARQITDTLLAHRTVLLNLEGLDVNTAQRIVDFASGSCYALHGNFMKISHFIIVITPEDVDIAGDITGGRQDSVSGILASAAAQGGMNGGMSGMGSMSGMAGMSGVADGSANPFVNNTMNMGSAY